MRLARTAILAALAVTFLCAGAIGPARADDDPFVKLDSRTEVELDLKMIVRDLVPPLLKEAKARNEEDASRLQAILDVLGVSSLDRLHMVATQTKNGGTAEATVTLDPALDGGLLRALSAVPPGRFRFGKYLDRDRVAILISLANFGGNLATLLEYAEKPEVQKLLPKGSGAGNGTAGPFGVDLKPLLPLLTGELDFAVFPPTYEKNLATPGFLVALATSDGPALRDAILQMLKPKLGEEQVSQLAAMSGKAAGAFTIYDLSGGTSYAVGPDYLVLASGSCPAGSLLSEPRGNIPPIPARHYVRINGDLMLHGFAPWSQMLQASGKAPGSAEIFHALAGQPFGTLEITSTSEPGRFHVEARNSVPMARAYYRMLRATLVAASAGRTERAQRPERGQATSYGKFLQRIDRAMSRYARDHDGSFPESPERLVTAGYLTDFPDIQPTPLGTYREDAYSYVPLRDEKGRVTGYYFFLYGNGKHSGFDVFTPENLADPVHFHAARDGVADGVVNFCYDGTAIGQVNQWKEKQ